MKLKTLLFSILLSLFVVSSCSIAKKVGIEKRRYRPGYYTAHSGHLETKAAEKKTKAQTTLPSENDESIALSDNTKKVQEDTATSTSYSKTKVEQKQNPAFPEENYNSISPQKNKESATAPYNKIQRQSIDNEVFVPDFDTWEDLLLWLALVIIWFLFLLLLLSIFPTMALLIAQILAGVLTLLLVVGLVLLFS